MDEGSTYKGFQYEELEWTTAPIGVCLRVMDGRFFKIASNIDLVNDVNRSKLEQLSNDGTFDPTILTKFSILFPQCRKSSPLSRLDNIQDNLYIVS